MKEIIFILFHFFFLIFFQSKVIAASDLVPVELSRKAAVHYTGEIFGYVRYFDYTTYINLDTVIEVNFGQQIPGINFDMNKMDVPYIILRKSLF